MIQQGMIEVAALEEEVVGANTNKSHTIPWTRTMRVLTLTWMCKLHNAHFETSAIFISTGGSGKHHFPKQNMEFATRTKWQLGCLSCEGVNILGLRFTRNLVCAQLLVAPPPQIGATLRECSQLSS